MLFSEDVKPFGDNYSCETTAPPESAMRNKGQKMCISNTLVHTHTHTHISVSHRFPSGRHTSHTTAADVRGALCSWVLCVALRLNPGDFVRDAELIDSHGHSARERRDGGGSNLASSSHPSSPSPVSPPIVLVKLWADTSVLLILFQPSTHLIFVINFTFAVGLIKTSHSLCSLRHWNLLLMF